jgi:hypothetical protein
MRLALVKAFEGGRMRPIVRWEEIKSASKQ